MSPAKKTATTLYAVAVLNGFAGLFFAVLLIAALMKGGAA